MRTIFSLVSFGSLAAVLVVGCSHRTSELADLGDAANTETSSETAAVSGESGTPVASESIPEASERAPASVSSEPQSVKPPSRSRIVGGIRLNRYYFVRLNETPNTVALKLYGNSKRSEDLTRWNGKSWPVGKMIVYASFKKPSDKKMISYYQEMGIRPERYSMKRGDRLSSIALENYGDSASWTEIAYTNKIKKPQLLREGKVLELYPAMPIIDEQSVIAMASQVPLILEAPIIPDAPQMEKPEVQEASVGVGGFLAQNWWVAIAGVGTLWFFLIALKRRQDNRYHL